MKKYSLRPIGNTVVSLLGGAGGEQLVRLAGLLQNSGMLGDVAGSAVGGGVLAGHRRTG